MRNTILFERAFLTGCDHTGEWLMPWFLRNLRKHNTTPIVFANFGVKNVSAIDVDHVIDMTGVREKGWFKKPKSIIDCPSKNTIWLDTDCEVLSDIEQLFDMLVPDKLCMVRDVIGRRKRTHLYNSGVVGVIDKPKTLHQWSEAISKHPTRGDQESLFRINQDGKMVHEWPAEYNWLRLMLDQDKNNSPDKKIMHWTGPKGKQRIRDNYEKTDISSIHR
jgi:hypothetical protein